MHCFKNLFMATTHRDSHYIITYADDTRCFVQLGFKPSNANISISLKILNSFDKNGILICQITDV